MSALQIEPEAGRRIRARKRTEPQAAAARASDEHLTSDRRLVLGAMISLALLAAAALLRLRAPDLLDHPVTLAFNSFARRSALVDYGLRALDGYNLFQGVPLLALACAALAVCKGSESRVRLAAGCVAAAGSALCSRGIQVFLPNLPRPLFDPALGFRPPYGADLTAMHDWSSFPSDHATLLWGVALAVFLANRRLGVLALVWVSISSLVRLYGGLHYATDIIAGALLGAICVFIATLVAGRWAKPLSDLAARWPALTAGLCFIFAVQAASLFDDVRMVASSTVQHLKTMHSHEAGPAQSATTPSLRPHQGD